MLRKLGSLVYSLDTSLLDGRDGGVLLPDCASATPLVGQCYKFSRYKTYAVCNNVAISIALYDQQQGLPMHLITAEGCRPSRSIYIRSCTKIMFSQQFCSLSFSSLSFRGGGQETWNIITPLPPPGSATVVIYTCWHVLQRWREQGQACGYCVYEKQWWHCRLPVQGTTCQYVRPGSHVVRGQVPILHWYWQTGKILLKTKSVFSHSNNWPLAAFSDALAWFIPFVEHYFTVIKNRTQ